jgi:ubiquinone/menaquinone biosynthesis C-methylase UbiE
MICEMHHAECPTFLELYRAAGGPGNAWTLDLGAGNGRLLPKKLGRDEGWVGLDLRRRPLLEAAERTRYRAGRCAFHQGNALALPYRDGAFACVLSNGLLHHVARPDLVFAEAVRVLAPAGLVLFRDLLPKGASETAPAWAQEARGSLLSLTTIRTLVGELGFPADTVSRAGIHWIWTARKRRFDVRPV